MKYRRKTENAGTTYTGPKELTREEKLMWAEAGRKAEPQLYEEMKAQGMSDEKFGDLWAAFG